MSERKYTGFAALYELDQKPPKKDQTIPTPVSAIVEQSPAQSLSKQADQALQKDQPIDQSKEQKDRADQQFEPITQSPYDPVVIQPRRGDPVATRPSRNTTRSASTLRPDHEATQLLEDPVAGFRVPNILEDQIIPTLNVQEQSVLRRLYRLSYGFNRQHTDSVGISKLAEKCNLGETSIKTALKSLQAKGLIKIEVDLSGNPKGGNRYFVLTGLLPNPVVIQPRRNTTPSPHDPIKDHDHDLKIHDHHQEQLTTIYQSLTGNQWTKKDTTAYSQIKNIPIEQIETTIRQVMERAPKKPGSLAYFVKEILNPTQANPKNRTAKRKEMERIIREVKDANRNRNGYLISELSDDVKDACARNGISFDNDLFNELTGHN